MTTSIATVFYAALILGLFWLDRDHKARTSVALWIPVVWLSLAGSRSVSEWLYLAPPATSPEVLLEGDPINRLVYAVLVAVGLVVLMFRGPNALRLLQANGAVVVFLLYCVLSLMWAENPDAGFKRWVKVVGDFVMVLIVVSDRDPLVAIKRLLTRTGFLLIPLSVLLIKYYPELSRYYDRWEWSTYYSGVTTNKNALGVICLLFGLASAWRFLEAYYGRDRTGWVRRLIAHGFMLAMVIWLFSLAQSMTALSCFFLGIVVLLIVGLRFRVRKPAIPLGLVGVSKPLMPLTLEFYPGIQRSLVVHALVACLIAVPSVVLFIGIEGILQMMGKDPTLTDRTLIWGLVINMATNPWFGTGFENFWMGARLDRIWSEYKWGPNQAHNGYLEIFLNLGWIGIGLLALLLLVGYQTIIARLHRFPSSGCLMLAYFVIGIVFNFTEAAFFRISHPAWFVFLLAITKVPDKPRAKRQSKFGRHLVPEMTPVGQKMTPAQLGS
jgi:O-antigen ligase